MSQIQVIGREAVDDANNLRDSAQKQAELQATIADKRATLNFYSQELEYKKKVATDEARKAEFANKSEKAKLLLKVFDDASKSPNPQQYLTNVAKMNIDLVSDVLGDPAFQSLAGKLQPSGDERLKGAAANVLESKFPKTNPNAPQVNAVQGNIPSASFDTGTARALEPGNPETMARMAVTQNQPEAQTPEQGQGAGGMGPDVSSINVGGVNIDFPEVQARMAALKKTAEMQAQKQEGQTVGETTAKDWSNKAYTAKALNDTVSVLLDNPNFRTYMGSFGGPKRAFAPFSKEGSLYAGFQANAMDIFNGYRTMVTGAQASEKELDKFISTVIGRPEKDTYESFLVKNVVGAATALGKINTDIKTYKGYDTTALQDMVPELTAALQKSVEAIQSQTGMDVSKVINDLNLPVDTSAIVKVMTEAAIRGTPVSYEAARRAVTKSKK